MWYWHRLLHGCTPSRFARDIAQLLVSSPVPHSRYAPDERQWNNTDSMLQCIFAKIYCPQFPGFGVSRNYRTGTKALILTLSVVWARPDPLWSPSFCFTDVAVRTLFAWHEPMPHGLLQLVAHGLDYNSYGLETWSASDCLRTQYVRTYSEDDYDLAQLLRISAPKRLSAAYLSLWELLTMGNWTRHFRR